MEAHLRRKLEKLKETLSSYKPEGNGLASNSQSHKPEGNGLASNSQSHKPEGNGLASNSQSHKPEGNGLASNSQSHKPEGNGLASNSQSHKKVIVAYSGGVDSSFLLKCSVDSLGKDSVIAVTAVSPTYTQKELQAAKEIAQGLGITHILINTSEVNDPNFKANPPNRCYYCKSELFSKLQSLAKKKGISFVIDGTNADDLKDYRPGSRARKELGVCSPLAEVNLTKEEIRIASKELGLKTWDAPQMSCLASRFAYGQEITLEDLKRIEKAEDYIRSLGFKMVRVRHYQLPDKTKFARIEVDNKDIRQVVYRLSSIVHRLKELGYTYVTLDLEGYRSGSMNPAHLMLRKNIRKRKMGGVNEGIKK